MPKIFKIIEMKRLIYLVFLLLIPNFIFTQKLDSRLKGIDKKIESIIKKYNAVGISVAVVENNQIVYSKGFGYRDLENKLPVNENTVFPIGSITKSFTASLIGILQDQNKISVLEKPAFYIPKFQFYNDKMDNLITINDLLCHRSGLGNVDGSYTFFPAKTRQDLMKRLKYLKPNGAINDSWIYSNFGYAILGTLVENTSGKSWENNIQEDIFNPLQMFSSSTDNKKMFATNNYSLGYGILEGEVKKVLFEQLETEKPAGGINSNVKDLSNYMKMWLNKGNFNEKNILSEKYIQEATSFKAIDNGAPPEENDPSDYLFGYGYGWKTVSRKGHYCFHHGGNISGFSSQMALFPTDKLGIVVLTNQNNSILPYVITDMITNRMLQLPQTDVNNYPVKVADIFTYNKSIKTLNDKQKPTHQLTDYCGKYTNAGYGTFEIIKEDNHLTIKFPRDKYLLEHQYYDIFMMKATEEISQFCNPEFYLNFCLDFDGNIESVKINFQNEPVAFAREK